VYPTHENAHVLAHPQSGKISDEGSKWEHDPFTQRLIDTNEISTDPARAHKFSANKKTDHGKPPARATTAGQTGAAAAAMVADSPSSTDQS
jgi:hypothetical protein